MYTKKEIADSLVKFINNDLMADITDSHLKFVLCMAKKSLKSNPDLLDSFMDNSLVASIVPKENDDYDLDHLTKVLKSVLSEYGTYAVTIPAVPIFAPKSSMIKITAEDVDKIIAYLSEKTQSEIS